MHGQNHIKQLSVLFYFYVKSPVDVIVTTSFFGCQIFAHVHLAFYHGQNWLALERNIIKAVVYQRILHNEYVDYSSEDLLHY